jgi:hypothetical protein
MNSSTLDYCDGHLCVLNESELASGSAGGTAGVTREWYAVREAAEAEVATLIGRPVRCADATEGLYVDDEGNPYQLAQQGHAKPLAAEAAPLPKERSRREPGPRSIEAREQTTLSPAQALASTAVPAEAQVRPQPLMRKRRGQAGAPVRARRTPQCPATQASAMPAIRKESADRAPARTAASSGMNLRQKLAEVRRRIGYIQKRGHNERANYRYVTAADIAGAVGDILALLGVVVVPSLESISYEPVKVGDAQVERSARVVMTYTFADVESDESITVKVPGEGLDVGDKASYKAMTGALKYALLQSFLLASGDDPEDDRHEARHRGAATHNAHPEHTISPDQIAELKQRIDDTGTELERVLAYYKIASLEEMTEPVYRRALELLNRKRAAQSLHEANHAQG